MARVRAREMHSRQIMQSLSDRLGLMAHQTAHKELAAAKAVSFVQSGMVVGLGAGSTAALALQILAAKLHSGVLRDVVGVACSIATAQMAQRFQIPIAELERYERVDLTLDGADEVDPTLDLIKGAGGALLREKIVAQVSRREVIVVDGSKLSRKLGTRCALPVEVIDFGLRGHLRFLESLGASCELRTREDGSPARTDQGNLLVDCSFGPVVEPRALAQALDARAGVVGHGLFLGIATDLVVADQAGVRHFTRDDIIGGRSLWREPNSTNFV